MDNKTIINTMIPCAESARIKKPVNCTVCEEQIMQLFETHCCGFDTSALMCVGEDDEKSALRQIRLLSIIEAACMRLDQAIFTSSAVFDELNRLSKDRCESIRNAARRALDLLNHLQNERLLEEYPYIDGEQLITSTEREMLYTTITVRRCSEKPVLVFTQDVHLATELLRQNQSILVSGPRISVYSIGESGQAVRFIPSKT
jgi:rRNA-processing protein FCF1